MSSPFFNDVLSRVKNQDATPVDEADSKESVENITAALGKNDPEKKPDDASIDISETPNIDGVMSEIEGMPIISDIEQVPSARLNNTQGYINKVMDNALNATVQFNDLKLMKTQMELLKDEFNDNPAAISQINDRFSTHVAKLLADGVISLEDYAAMLNEQYGRDPDLVSALIAALDFAFHADMENASIQNERNVTEAEKRRLRLEHELNQRSGGRSGLFDWLNPSRTNTSVKPDVVDPNRNLQAAQVLANRFRAEVLRDELDGRGRGQTFNPSQTEGFLREFNNAMKSFDELDGAHQVAHRAATKIFEGFVRTTPDLDALSDDDIKERFASYMGVEKPFLQEFVKRVEILEEKKPTELSGSGTFADFFSKLKSMFSLSSSANMQP